MSHDHTHEHTNRCFWAYDEARWVCRPMPAPQPRPELGDVDTLLAMLHDAEPELVTT